jgi:hypothetical protein
MESKARMLNGAGQFVNVHCPVDEQLHKTIERREARI